MAFAPVATAVLGTGALAGRVVAINVSTPGTGYTQAPAVSLGAPPAGGTQATASSVLTAAGAWGSAAGTAPGGNATGLAIGGLGTGVAYQFRVRANPVPGGAGASNYVQVPAGGTAVVAP